jgi:hypothetical protein
MGVPLTGSGQFQNAAARGAVSGLSDGSFTDVTARQGGMARCVMASPAGLADRKVCQGVGWRRDKRES